MAAERLVKMWESVLESNKYTNKEIEEKFYGDYLEAITKEGLDKENWNKMPEKIRKELDKLEEEVYQDSAPEEEEIGFGLPEEINFDSDCDGFDTCWTNTWYLYKNKNGKVKYIVFEQYLNSCNKYYGNYNPNAQATLAHTLIVYKVQGNGN